MINNKKLMIMCFFFLAFGFTLAGCGNNGSKKVNNTPTAITPSPIERDEKKFYVPQLSVKWDQATKIVGNDNSEFLSDFLLIQDKQLKWHCIGIGGQGHVQDSFFHAVSDNLLTHFTYVDRVNSNGTEMLKNMDWMWAPYAVFADDNSAYMYYCHWDKTVGAQMRMLKSTDNSLNTWVKADLGGLTDGNIAFTEKADRDACIFYDETAKKYFMYYAGTQPTKDISSINLRTSVDLVNWSEPVVVMTAPTGFIAPESPFVIKRFGYYYLFVSGYDYGRVAIYASKDPATFGDPNKDKLGELNGHAPEIVSYNGKDYVACAAINTNIGGRPGESNMSGVYLQELKWVAVDDAKWLDIPQPTQTPEEKYVMPAIITAEADYYWNCDEDTPKMSNHTFIDGVKGKALLFDGSTSIKLSDTKVNLASNFTISLYIKMDTPSGDFNVIMSKGDKNAAHFEIYVQPSGAISFYQFELGIHDIPANICDKHWHNVVFTFDGKNVKGYLDGKVVYSKEATAKAPMQDDDPICFGAFNDKTYYFNGALDEVKIFNRVLTDNEILGK